MNHWSQAAEAELIKEKRFDECVRKYTYLRSVSRLVRFHEQRTRAAPKLNENTKDMDCLTDRLVYYTFLTSNDPDAKSLNGFDIEQYYDHRQQMRPAIGLWINWLSDKIEKERA